MGISPNVSKQAQSSEKEDWAFLVYMNGIGLFCYFGSEEFPTE